MDGALNTDKNGTRIPNPGDFSICIYCGSLNVFDDNLELRQPTVDEYVASTKMRDVQRARELILNYNYLWNNGKKKKTSQK